MLQHMSIFMGTFRLDQSFYQTQAGKYVLWHGALSPGRECDISYKSDKLQLHESLFGPIISIPH